MKKHVNTMTWNREYMGGMDNLLSWLKFDGFMGDLRGCLGG